MSAAPKLPYRCQLLQTAIDITRGDRQQTHGDFMEALKVEAVLKGLYRSFCANKYTPEHNAAMEMALLKIVRIMLGSALDDHYVDLMGYVAAAREAEVHFGIQNALSQNN